MDKRGWVDDDVCLGGVEDDRRTLIVSFCSFTSIPMPLILFGGGMKRSSERDVDRIDLKVFDVLEDGIEDDVGQE